VLRALRELLPTLEVRVHEEHGVKWNRDAKDYDDGSLLAWHSRARSLDVLDADLVLSDNLAAVLGARPDAVLMGSFLWSDVLSRAYPTSSAVQAFVERDEGLLREHRPDMICLEAFAMPAVREQTNAIAVEPIVRGPVDSNTLKRGPDGCLVFAAGGTRAADALLAPLHQHAAVAASVVWRDEVDAIDNAAVVIGRPGIGTVTECIEHGVPLLAVCEDNSPEMTHNAERVAALGLGATLGDPTPRALDAAVAHWRGAREVVRRAARVLGTAGARQAAGHLAARLVKGRVA
jgi:hypothetical protein